MCKQGVLPQYDMSDRIFLMRIRSHDRCHIRQFKEAAVISAAGISVSLHVDLLQFCLSLRISMYKILPCTGYQFLLLLSLKSSVSVEHSHFSIPLRIWHTVIHRHRLCIQHLFYDGKRRHSIGTIGEIIVDIRYRIRLFYSPHSPEVIILHIRIHYHPQKLADEPFDVSWRYPA